MWELSEKNGVLRKRLSESVRKASTVIDYQLISENVKEDVMKHCEGDR